MIFQSESFLIVTLIVSLRRGRTEGMIKQDTRVESLVAEELVVFRDLPLPVSKEKKKFAIGSPLFTASIPHTEK